MSNTTVQTAIEELEFKHGDAIKLRWEVGFHARGMGRGDFAVICNWDKREHPVVIVKCPTKEIAEHIVDTHNEHQSVITTEGIKR